MTRYQQYYISRKVREHLPIKVNAVRHGRSIRSRVCVYCGCEIVKGDYYYSYKNYFGNRKSRCLDHPPKIYNDFEPYDI